MSFVLPDINTQELTLLESYTVTANSLPLFDKTRHVDTYIRMLFVGVSPESGLTRAWAAWRSMPGRLTLRRVQR